MTCDSKINLLLDVHKQLLKEMIYCCMSYADEWTEFCTNKS